MKFGVSRDLLEIKDNFWKQYGNFSEFWSEKSRKFWKIKIKDVEGSNR